MSSLRLSVLVPMLAIALGGTATAQQLPNGASSINETYGDWSVNCRMIEGQKLCLLGHVQANSQNGQRLFAVDLRTPKDGKTEGTIVMPFGLKLESGAVMKLDDKDLGQGLRFSTCVPQGCLMPVSLPAAATDAMKKGKTLTVASLNLSGGDVVSFNVPLAGFAAAIARVAELSK
jgi:invasion protein IalB